MSWKRTIRFRLFIGIIAIIVLANTLISLLTILNVSSVLIQEVQTRVRLNLNSAQEVYEQRLISIAQFLRAVSLDGTIASALEHRKVEQVERLLQKVRQEGGMDMLSLLDPSGRVLFRARNPRKRGDHLAKNPVVALSLKKRKPIRGTVIIPRERMLLEGWELAERAYFEIRKTPAALPSNSRIQMDGMAMAAAIPILSSRGHMLGLLYGTELLNRRYELVDRIKNEVFQKQTSDGKEIGTATIFQGSLRISTNVQTMDGNRAIGTQMSAAVSDRVLRQGLIWADRAFVVNDWYITAYRPIRDPNKRIIGALYVGLLEAPIVRPQKTIVTVFLTVMSLITLTSFVLLFLVTKLILRPISRIIQMSRRVIGGDLSARVSIRPPGEMGLLCQAIDHMAEAVSHREEQLKQVTYQQIGQSEKLASIGRLAAGIAHEINNPLTGVLTFAHLLQKRESLHEQDREDLEVILRETTRVREIVRGLLDFARESPSKKQSLDINEVILQTVTLVRSQKEFRKISIREILAEELPLICGDKNQLQQVLLNISLNACEAMPQGGTLKITTSRDNDHVIMTINDTGYGIEKEHLGRVFDPFFTTKPVGKGTGLGLSVSYGIVQQHNGAIEVDSVVGQGTTFTVFLPAIEKDDVNA